MRLVRDNTDDTRLMDDLALLAGEPARASVDVLDPVDTDAEVAPDDEVEEVREPSVLDDPFVHRFVQLTTHVRRYVSFYVGGVAWILALVLIQPLGGAGDDGPEVAGSRRAPSTVGAVASASSPVASVPPSSRSALALTAAPVLDFSTPTFEDVGGSSLPSDDFSTPASSDELAGGSDTSAAPTFADTDDEFSSSDDGPAPLTITRSGYASITGGTPLEQQPPENGLPVAAAGGQVGKFSYIALSGAETTLRLKPVEAPGGNVAPERAGIRACLITTAGWEPKRGVATSAAPQYDTTACATGLRGSDGIWTFDVMDFGDVSTINGLALVPVADPTLEFLVTFRPVAERAEVE